MIEHPALIHRVLQNTKTVSRRHSWPRRVRLGASAAWIAFSLELGSLQSAAGARFTPVQPVHVRIASHAAAYAGGRFDAGQLIDGNSETEYASENLGTNTFVEFEFPAPLEIVAFRHLDRADPARVGASELVFSDAAGKVVERLHVNHPDRRSAETFLVFPKPIIASRVRWQVTMLGGNGIGTVGGAEVGFYSADAVESVPNRDVVQAHALPFIDQQGLQPVRVTVDHPYLEQADATLHVPGGKPIAIELKHGVNAIELNVPSVAEITERSAELEFDPNHVKVTRFQQKRVRPMTIYILPHSHTDIGYTDLQAAVEEKQINNLRRGMELAQETAAYPAGARYVWNVEVLWAAECFLKQANRTERERFFTAVRQGQIELNGMYLNELTALCRPEELIQLFRFAAELSARTGKPIESAMISDVPGQTWGTVSAMAQAGIRYLSSGPNYGEREFMNAWADKPFFWIGPDGKSKVLVWVPFQGYALSHIYDSMSPRLLNDLCSRLQDESQPYDIAHIRWAGHGDNGVPDAGICDFVKEWNATHRSPQFVISGTTEAFRAFEERYGASIPVYRGDWTPYWEDGAGSSARETGLNRQSSDRLTQAQTLFAMFNPKQYPKDAFDEAWRNILLYSEHTWGAQGSVSHPEDPQSEGQWAVKKAYAENADQESADLMRRALETGKDISSSVLTDGSEVAGRVARIGFKTSDAATHGLVDVINTLSWERTEIVTVPRELSSDGDRVVDAAGRSIPSQRLRSGELAFLARDVPPFGIARYRIEAGSAYPIQPGASVHGCELSNGKVKLCVDEETGGIVELRCGALRSNFAGQHPDRQLNRYVYLRGESPDEIQTNGPVRISFIEPGPLVASLMIESDAPGCRSLRREIRLAAGRDYVELFNHVDKARLMASNYRSRKGKESLSFAFPFNVPDGELMIDLPLAGMRPGRDALPASCRGWFTVGRWATLSGSNDGMTWVTLDAPLLQLEDPMEELKEWRPGIHKNQSGARRLYSWVMNNRWGTNYRPYQDGPATFRYVLRPERKPDPAGSTRFAMQFTQPLIVSKARSRPPSVPLPGIDSDEVIVIAAKPSDDGAALILRLFGASGEDRSVSLRWVKRPTHLFTSDTSENEISPAGDRVKVPGFGVVTLRAEFN